MADFEKFPTWNALLSAIGRGERVFYHAPLDRNPVLVRCELRARAKVRVFPPSRDADPFTADASHLDRFKRVAADETFPELPACPECDEI